MRDGSADLMKGVAVLLMIQVHLVELFALHTTLESDLGRGSLFFGGPFVAPVFMAVMGYFLAKSRKSMGQLCLRGGMLLGLGLLLNVGMNLHLLIRIFQKDLLTNYYEFLFGIDILILAGAGVIIIALLRAVFGKHPLPYFIFVVSIVYLTPHVAAPLSTESALRYVYAFIGGSYRWSYFPLFPWLAYPLAGYAFYLLKKNVKGPVLRSRILAGIAFISGIALVLTVKYAVGIAADLPVYYHHDYLFFLWTAGFLVFWTSGLTLANRFWGNWMAFSYVKWLGKNVTTAYIIQWLIIGNIATAIYKTQETGALFWWFVGILAVVSGLLWLLQKIPYFKRPTA